GGAAARPVPADSPVPAMPLVWNLRPVAARQVAPTCTCSWVGFNGAWSRGGGFWGGRRGAGPPGGGAPARSVADYYATTLGSVLAALLIPVLPDELPSRFSKGSGYEIERNEMPQMKRATRYKKLLEADVRAPKGAHMTTLLVVPTQAEADEWATMLAAYAPLVLSSALSAKRREAAIGRACGAPADAPTLLICTPGFAWIPVSRLSRIIVERVSAGTYLYPKRPHLHTVDALTELARARAIPILYGDYPLPLEYRAHPDKPLKEAPSGTITLLDTRTRKEDGKDTGVTWKAIPDTLRAEIGKTLMLNGRTAILAVRRGYTPTVVCRDCGTAVTDEHGRTLSLVTIQSKRMLRSTDGTTIENAKTLCKNCGGWNLIPLGIGSERVEEEVRQAFPDAFIVRIDQDTTTSRARLRASIAEPGAIIVGTESMLAWLSPEQPVDLGIIASADSLLSLPFWRARERFVRVGLLFAERAKRLIVATRRGSTDAALSALANPTGSTFWQEEDQLRKVLNYPPYGTLIVFQVEGTAARISDARAAIATACTPYTPSHLPTHPVSATMLRGVSVVQIPHEKWPDSDLSSRIARLSPAIRVHIDSESFW
ncbi:MAG: hypothetical protein P4M11_00240, partial [Candidatus Pacebacteria bacterium]|nr:hypothetical protein [Candidatus Paceibacterota bacterium]